MFSVYFAFYQLYRLPSLSISLSHQSMQQHSNRFLYFIYHQIGFWNEISLSWQGCKTVEGLLSTSQWIKTFGICYYYFFLFVVLLTLSLTHFCLVLHWVREKQNQFFFVQNVVIIIVQLIYTRGFSAHSHTQRTRDSCPSPAMLKQKRTIQSGV